MLDTVESPRSKATSPSKPQAANKDGDDDDDGDGDDVDSDKPPTKGAHPLLARYRAVDSLLERSIECFQAAIKWHERHAKSSGPQDVDDDSHIESEVATEDPEDTSSESKLEVPTKVRTSKNRKNKGHKGKKRKQPKQSSAASSSQHVAKKTQPENEEVVQDEEYESLLKKLAFTWNERARFQVGTCLSVCLTNV